MKNKILKVTKYSIRGKLLFIMMGLVLTLLTLITIIQVSSQRTLFKEEANRRIILMKEGMIQKGKTLSKNIARYTENAISAYDFFGIDLMLKKSVMEEEDLEYGILVDYDGVAHLHSRDQDLLETKLTSAEDRFALKQNEFAVNEYKRDFVSYLEFITPVKIGDIPWGVLRLGFSLTDMEDEISASRIRMEKKLNELLIRSAVIAVAFVLIGGIWVVYSINFITKSLQILTDFSNKLATEDFDAKIPETVTESNDEIGTLSRTFKMMAKNLKTSYEKLEDYSKTLEQKVEDRTKELQKAFEEIKESQEQLIQAEKMASLGQLVAGVAHEINTPIGIGVTSATFLQEQISKLNTLLKSDKIHGSELDSLIHYINESSNLILSNLRRASELIVSFKKTSADQASQERRTFNMHTVVSDTIISLRPKIKKTNIEVSLLCPKNMIVDSFPGAISQVITNLVMNSLIHAFEQGVKGKIEIKISEGKNKEIEIVYSDNGKGIPAKLKKTLFDPFVTTIRGEGGSGLGLHIVFNIVNSVLKGKIHLQDNPEGGSIFIMTMIK